MGGKFNGKHISAVSKKGKEEQHGAAANIAREHAEKAGTWKPGQAAKKKDAPKTSPKTSSESTETKSETKQKYVDNQEVKKTDAIVVARRKKWNNLITTTMRNSLESSPEYREVVRRILEKKKTDPTYKQDFNTTLRSIKDDEKIFVAGAGNLLGIKKWVPRSPAGHRIGEAPVAGALLRILQDVYQDKTPSEIVKMTSDAASGEVAEFDGRKEIKDKRLAIVQERRKLESSGVDTKLAATKVPLPEGFVPVLSFTRDVDYEKNQAFVSPPDTGLKISKETEKAVLVSGQWAPKSGIVIDNGFVVGAKPWLARDRN